jgi:hypothetical protein
MYLSLPCVFLCFKIYQHHIASHLESRDYFISEMEGKELASVGPYFCHRRLYNSILAGSLAKFWEFVRGRYVVDWAVSPFMVSKVPVETISSLSHGFNFNDIAQVIGPIEFPPAASHCQTSHCVNWPWRSCWNEYLASKFNHFGYLASNWSEYCTVGSVRWLGVWQQSDQSENVSPRASSEEGWPWLVGVILDQKGSLLMRLVTFSYQGWPNHVVTRDANKEEQFNC